MTNEEMIYELQRTDDGVSAIKYQIALDFAINSIQENTKLKAEIEQLKAGLEQFKNIHKSSIVEIGMEVFVITQYGTHEKEIIKCKVNRKTLKSKITFSVNGLYKNFNCYNGTFTDSSIGKKVFLSREEAEQSLKNKINDKQLEARIDADNVKKDFKEFCDNRDKEESKLKFREVE